MVNLIDTKISPDTVTVMLSSWSQNENTWQECLILSLWWPINIIFFAGNLQQDANQVHSPFQEQQEDAGGLHSAVLEAAGGGLDCAFQEEQDADGLNSHVQEEASINTSKSMIYPAISHVVTGKTNLAVSKKKICKIKDLATDCVMVRTHASLMNGQLNRHQD